jgi:hypothetical protein
MATTKTTPKKAPVKKAATRKPPAVAVTHADFARIIGDMRARVELAERQIITLAGVGVVVLLVFAVGFLTL